MPELAAEKYDVEGTVSFFARQAGDFSHLRVREHGALLAIESGPHDDPTPHARSRRVTKQDGSLEMSTHTGRWRKTGLRDQRLALLGSWWTTPVGACRT